MTKRHLWNGASVGMSVKEVMSLFPSAVRLSNSNSDDIERLYDGSKGLLVLDYVNLVGYDGFTAKFFFSNWLMRLGSILPSSFGILLILIGERFAVLKQVNISFSEWRDEDPVEEIRKDCLPLLIENLNGKHGAPVEKDIIEGMSFDLVYQDGETKISLGVAGVGGSAVNRFFFGLSMQSRL